MFATQMLQQNTIQKIIKAVDHPTVKSSLALFIQLTGSLAAGMMMDNLISWAPFSTRQDHRVFKSHKDWFMERGISHGQVKLVHKNRTLQQFGIDYVVMKANGAPTCHYGIDWDVLIQKMAEFLGVPVDYLVNFTTQAHEIPTTSKKQYQSKEKAALPADIAGKYDDIVNNFEYKPTPEDIKEARLLEESPMIGTEKAYKLFKDFINHYNHTNFNDQPRAIFRETKYVSFDVQTNTLKLSVTNERNQVILQQQYILFAPMLQQYFKVYCKVEVIISKHPDPPWLK
jgi:uncharacterized protein YutD